MPNPTITPDSVRPPQAGASGPPTNAGPSKALPVSRKRHATDNLPGLQPLKSTKLNRREEYVSDMGIHGTGLPPGRTKTESLAQWGTDALRNPLMSPVGAIGQANAGDLLNKVAAPNAGDHSPSVSSVNGVVSNETKVLGRSDTGVGGGFKVQVAAVPTLQFTTGAFVAADGTHLEAKDAAAHTVFTSLREMNGAGEKSVHANMDPLLDNTAHAYSPYNALGDVAKGDVRLPKVNVHSENKTGPKLHKSEQGVDPLIAQQMINLWYCGNKGG